MIFRDDAQVVSRKKVKMYIPEEDLAELLGYWSKGQSIPVELEVTQSKVHGSPREISIGPGDRPLGDMKELAKRWLGEEGITFSESGEGLEVSSFTKYPVIIRLRGSKKACISCKMELGTDAISWFRRMEKDEIETFLADLKMVLALKPCDFSILTKSALPVGLELSSTIYTDGYTKDRLMSVLSDIRRSASLALTIIEGKSGQSAINRTIRRYGNGHA